MIKGKRKIINVGKYSKGVILPSVLEMGEYITLAADRLILADPRGKINPSDLLEFLEMIEPKFWEWMETKN